MADFDLVVRGGTVVDGTGAKPFRADVGIKDGLIAAVGQDIGAGKEEIDAGGKLVTPGFVDIHTHFDGQVTWDPMLTPTCWHGVTSVVMGNCGVGFAPVQPGREQWLIELMEGVEDIPGVVLNEGLAWNWQSFPEFMDAVDGRPRQTGRDDRTVGDPAVEHHGRRRQADQRPAHRLVRLSEMQEVLLGFV